MVREIAVRHRIVGYVRNLPDMTVEIVCQGTTQKIEEFTESITIIEEFVIVQNVETIEEKEIGNATFEYFVIQYDEFVREFDEYAAYAIKHLKAMNDSWRSVSNSK